MTTLVAPAGIEREFTVVLAVSMVGDGIQAAFDPARTRER